MARRKRRVERMEVHGGKRRGSRQRENQENITENGRETE